MREFDAEPTDSLPIAVFGIPLQRFLLAAALIAGLGVYTGILLFGPNSLTVLLGLEEQRQSYEKHIRLLKAKNAALQKENFELQELEPEP